MSRSPWPKASAVETRGNFYEATGALRDMVPNHLFQLVAMTAMEPPVSFDAEDIRAKKAEMFRAIHPLSLGDVVRGQYDAGIVGDEKVKAYRAEDNVSPDSTVETYVAMRILIDNWRWAGVPFYLRTGKRLTKRSTEIAIRFKRAPYALFRETPVEELDADWLILRDPAGRRHPPALQRQAAGSGHGAGKRGDEFPIQGLFPAGAGGRL